MESTFLKKAYHWSLGLTAHSFSPKKFQTVFPGICPSEPKQASLLLTQSLPIKLKTRVELSFCFVFWGFLQGAMTPYWWQGQQEPEMLLVLHRSWHCPYCPRMLQGQKSQNIPFPLPSHKALAPLLWGRIESLLFSQSSSAVSYFFGKARGEENALPSPSLPSFPKITAVEEQVKWSRLPREVTDVPQYHGGRSARGATLLLPRWHHGQTPLSYPPYMPPRITSSLVLLKQSFRFPRADSPGACTQPSEKHHF